MRPLPLLTLAFLVATAHDAVAGEHTSLSLRAFVEYDDNVGLNTEDSTAPDPLASIGAGLAVNLSHSFTRGRDHELRGRLTAFHTQQLDDAAEDFDASGLATRLALSNRWVFGARPATLATTLGARGDWLGGEEYSQVSDLGSTLLVELTRSWSFGPSVNVSNRDYEAEGLDPALSSRDALRYALGLTSEHRFASPAGPRAPGRLRLAVGAQRNDADGTNYQYAAWIGSLELTLPLRAPRTQGSIRDLALQFSVNGSDADYADFEPPVDRIDRRMLATLGLTTQIAAVGRLDVSYSWLAIESNLAQFAARRRLVRVGLTHSF